MNYVFDTHVWVSLFYNHRIEIILNQIHQTNSTIFSCLEQEKEFADIHHKHQRIIRMLPLSTESYLYVLRIASTQIESEKRFRLLYDYKDNYLIDLAHITKSTLVSNDRGFDILKKFNSPKIKVIKISDFYLEIKL